MVFQIFGNEPNIMALGAKIAETVRPDFIDLNFGCPVRKVINRGAGAALMKDLPRLAKIVKNVVSAVSTPVSCKIRSGWDKDNMNAVEAARIIQEEGGCMITVHPRTQTMGFTGKADWSVIGDVKKAVSIPVIGNGDILTPHDAKKMIDETGCDLIMIGRGAMGRPWIIQQINDYLEKGVFNEDPDYQERIELLIQHYLLAFQVMDPRKAFKEMRKHIGWSLKGMRGNGRVKDEIYHLSNKEEVIKRLNDYAQELKENEDRKSETGDR